MNLSLTGEQELLRDGLSKFLTNRYDLENSRTAAKTGAGWQPRIWQTFADELGILGATLPESVGGLGGGAVEVMVIADALGHALVIEPYVNTVVVAGGLLHRAGGERATAVLTRIAGGTAVVALAVTEPDTGDDLTAVSATADTDGGGWTLTGTKIVVVDAPLATHLLVVARAPQGLSLFLTEFDAAAPPDGVEVHSYRTIDDRRAADL
ncbi:MAG: acdA 8, partial [Mycobacterium sp.]|nr:acdA 8 [Mycobacterium sp.]